MSCLLMHLVSAVMSYLLLLLLHAAASLVHDVGSASEATLSHHTRSPCLPGYAPAPLLPALVAASPQGQALLS